MGGTGGEDSRKASSSALARFSGYIFIAPPLTARLLFVFDPIINPFHGIGRPCASMVNLLLGRERASEVRVSPRSPVNEAVRGFG